MTYSKVKIIQREKGVYTSNNGAINFSSDSKPMSPKDFLDSLNFRCINKSNNGKNDRVNKK